MGKNLVVQLIFLLWGGFSSAENHLVYFGGDKSNNTSDSQLFNDQLKRILDYSKKTSWRSEFYYQKNLPSELPEKEKKGIKEFSPDSFQEKILSLKKDLRNGKIKSGDQLLVYIDAHGRLDQNRDFVISTDQGAAHSEVLKGLIALAEEKKVKLGVVGMNCYSGSLLRFRTPNTCIVTLSQADKLGFDDDATNFSSLVLKKAGSTNLEEVFLNSRYDQFQFSFSPSQPMISTEAGVLVDENLSALKEGIFHEIDLYQSQLQPLCKNSTLKIETLEAKIASLAQLLQLDRKSVIEPQRLEKLKALLREYNDLYTGTSPFSKYANDLACSKDGDCLEVFEIDLYETLPLSEKDRQWVNELKTTTAYKNFKRFIIKHEPYYQRMKDLSLEISQEERALYDQLYKLASQKMKGPNPCRDFKL